MGTPNIEGLKLALVDGSSSIKRSDSIQVNPNQTSELLIKSLIVTNSKYAGKPTPLEIKFNPWLNSIIGGRGSGKSSLLEFIRVVTQRGGDLFQLSPTNDIRQVFESFIKVSNQRDAEGVMLSDTEIICDYQKQSSLYRLRWRQGTNATEIFFWNGSSWTQETGNVHQRFPVKIFSQKQIFNLAQHPNFLLKLIDQSEYVDIQNWSMSWQQKENEYYRLAGRRRELLSQIENKTLIQGQLADVIRKISVIEASGHQNVLGAFHSSMEKAQGINNFISSYDSGVANLGSFLDSFVPPPPPTPLQADSQEDLEVLNQIRSLYRYHADFAKAMRDVSATFTSRLDEFKAWYDSSKLKGSYFTHKNAYESLMASLQISGVSNPNEYQELINQKLNLHERLQQIDVTEKELQSVTASLISSHEQLTDLRVALSKRRHDFLVNYFSDSDFISVELKPFLNSESVDFSFRKAIARQDATFVSDIYDEERSSGILVRLLAELKAENQHLAIQEIAKARSLIIGKLKAQITGERSGVILGFQVGKRFSDYLYSMTPQLQDTLYTWFPDDELVVKFNDGNRYKDISQGSAGQKSAAILSFLLSYGQEPLILDQPEDDLDNGLVSSLIVAKLHACKNGRQIIVATHNPNIVVNGDSDYVITIQQNKGQLQVGSSGALQEQGVREKVCEIMEGGRAALELRYRRMISHR